MNEKLSFSWSHIFAFLALIAVSYLSFVGFTYLTNGNFTTALIGMAVTDLLYIVFFIGAQQLKASGESMKIKIIFERIAVFTAPIIFIAGMISVSHFWTVHSHNDEIVDTFNESINSSKKLFDDYESYSTARIDNYEKMLNKIIADRKYDPSSFSRAGFVQGKAHIQKDNMVEALRLQLLSQNYDSLRTEAIAWIDKSSNGASTWNVFLLGNTREIASALNSWENQLKGYSEKAMFNEMMKGDVYMFSSDEAQKAISGIEGLTATYTQMGPPSLPAIIFAVVCFLMLMVPYWIQDRHAKNVYRLVGSEKTQGKPSFWSKHIRPLWEKITGDNDGPLPELEEDPDYPSFTVDTRIKTRRR